MRRTPDYDAARARAKRPVPMWADAFLRDTMHLEADEIGAYHLILYAMWRRPDCDFPDDDKRLAKVSRVSLRLWKSRIGPTLREFFTVESGCLVSKRLRKEAAYTERQGAQQSNRKRDEKYGKSLKPLDAGRSADTTADPSAALSYPTTQVPTLGGGGGSAHAREDLRPRVLAAVGIDAPGITPAGKVVFPESDVAYWTERWATLGLTEDEQVSIIELVASQKRDGPPGSLKYFEEAMRRAAGRKQAPPPTPIIPDEESSRDRPDHAPGRPDRPRGRGPHDAFAEGFLSAGRDWKRRTGSD